MARRLFEKLDAELARMGEPSVATAATAATSARAPAESPSPPVDAREPRPPKGRPVGETVPLGDDSIAKAVAALPFAGNTVGAALVSYPRLSLQA